MTESNKRNLKHPNQFDPAPKQPKLPHDHDHDVATNLASTMASPYALDPDVKSPLSASPSTE